MTKHALNAFLATSVTFINEMAALCEQVGADATEVERGLKTEARIGPKGVPVAGGGLRRRHPARDVRVLIALGDHHASETPMFHLIWAGDQDHRDGPSTRSARGSTERSTLAPPSWG